MTVKLGSDVKSKNNQPYAKTSFLKIYCFRLWNLLLALGLILAPSWADLGPKPAPNMALTARKKWFETGPKT